MALGATTLALKHRLKNLSNNPAIFATFSNLTAAELENVQNPWGIINPQRDWNAVAAAQAHWGLSGDFFAWGNISSAPDFYNWAAADQFVRSATAAKLNVVGIIWPFADFDQTTCHQNAAVATALHGATRRAAPCDANAVRAYIKELVGRYADVGAPKTLSGARIRVWMLGDAPDRQENWHDTPQSYAAFTALAYAAIKETCKYCQVLHGAATPTSLFWRQALPATKADISALAASSANDWGAGAWYALLNQAKKDWRIWLFGLPGQPQAILEQARAAKKYGADKFFFSEMPKNIDQWLQLPRNL